MHYVRGIPRDYNYWSSLGNPQWGWKDVLPYFMKSEANNDFIGVHSNSSDYHSDKGELKVELFVNSEPSKVVMLEAAAAKGYKYVADINADTPLGYSYVQGFLNKGARHSGAKAFLMPEKDNIHIIKYAQATRIDVDKNGVATGIDFLYNATTKMTVKATKEILVSAGPIGSPQLLMLSGIGPQNHLDKMNIPLIKDLPVGRNLQDHLIVPLFFSFDKTEATQMSREELLDAIYLYALHSMGPLTSHGSSDLVAFLNTVDSTAEYADIQLQHMTFRKNAFDLQFFLTVSGYAEMIGRQILDLNRMGDVVIVYIGLLKPRSRGSVHLSSSDAKELPTIVANYLNDPEDMETLVKAVKFQADYVNTEELKKHEGMLIRLPLPACKQLEYETDDYWRCYIEYMSRSGNHQFGSTRMGHAKDKSAVVDERLRVHGVEHLRVIGSSIMPAPVSSSSNAVTFMIGEKAADYVKQDWKYTTAGAKDEL